MSRRPMKIKKIKRPFWSTRENVEVVRRTRKRIRKISEISLSVL